jgi:pimeloyl-ACP methyl ester carboxylesterase
LPLIGMATMIIDRMAVEVDGSGDAVALIHGLGGTSNVFDPQARTLAGRFRVIRPDLPGSGRSPAGRPLSIQAFVDAILRALRLLGVERAHLAGHSLGTVICQHIAAQQPALVRSLALFGPFAAPSESARAGLRERAQQARGEGMAPIADAIVASAISGDTRQNRPVAAAFVRELVMRQESEGYARTCEALAEGHPADLRAVRCRALLLTGDEDAIAPPANVRALGERLAGARVEVFNRCGHWTPVERAAETGAALNEFLSGRG